MPITIPFQTEALREVVLFAFDDKAFPFQHHLQKHLIQPTNQHLVLEPGIPGSHDEVVLYYGTVLCINDTFHLWYFGSSGQQRANIGQGHGSSNRVLCYATSTDGFHWHKPELGLVEFNNSKRNNIVSLPDPGLRPAAAILYEPADSECPYKLAYEARVDGKDCFCVAFSHDGLQWQPFHGNPVGPFLEMAGITRFQGMYYVVGQGPLTAHRPARTRHLTVFASRDFEHWSPCGAVGLDRSPDITGPSIEANWNHIEEVHLGAGLWNRGNIIIGIYGQWHGHPSGDRRFLTMDLGLAISHNAIHYMEPIPGFAIISAREQPFSPTYELPALMQGQGMHNLGDETYYWYSLWKGMGGTGIRLATWERDRLGKLKPFYPHDARTITCLLRIEGEAQVYANISGLGEYSQIRITVLDEAFQPLANYTNAVITENGLRVLVIWEGGSIIANQTIRLDIQFIGIRPEDCELHAIYVVQENT
jgi:hypothetical protein